MHDINFSTTCGLCIAYIVYTSHMYDKTIIYNICTRKTTQCYNETIANAICMKVKCKLISQKYSIPNLWIKAISLKNTDTQAF